jgi:hypothetical protein
LVQVELLQRKQQALQSAVVSARAEQQYLQFLDDRIQELKHITGEAVFQQEQELLEQSAASNPTDSMSAPAAESLGMHMTHDLLEAEVKRQVALAMAAAGVVGQRMATSVEEEMHALEGKMKTLSARMEEMQRAARDVADKAAESARRQEATMECHRVRYSG